MKPSDVSIVGYLGKSQGMNLDQIFWIFAFVCFTIAAVVGDRIPSRFNLIAAGLAFGALTFITG